MHKFLDSPLHSPTCLQRETVLFLQAIMHSLFILVMPVDYECTIGLGIGMLVSWGLLELDIDLSTIVIGFASDTLSRTTLQNLVSYNICNGNPKVTQKSCLP